MLAILLAISALAIDLGSCRRQSSAPTTSTDLDTAATPTSTSADSAPTECLNVGQLTIHDFEIGDPATCVPFFSSGDGSKSYKNLILGIPGMDTSAATFNQIIGDAAQSCLSDTRIISVEFNETARYNLLGKSIVGSFTLNEVMDAFVTKFTPDDQSVTIAGFSKGAQAVQRYSLVRTAKTAYPPRYLLGCASSWTFLDPTVDFRYGLANIPAPFDPADIVPLVQKSTYLIACGSKDVKDLDTSEQAMAEGSGRIERAQGLLKSLQDHDVDASMTIVDGVGHNAAAVIGAQGDFLCRK